MKYNKYRREDYDEVMRLKTEEGLGAPNISKITGIPQSTVSGWLSGKYRPHCIWTKEEKDAWNESRRVEWTDEMKANLSAKRWGPDNPMWKGDDAGIGSCNERARRLYNPPEGKEIHHIDGNPCNNEPENIDFVTRRDHMVIDGRLEKLIKRIRLGKQFRTLEGQR